MNGPQDQSPNPWAPPAPAGAPMPPAAQPGAEGAVRPTLPPNGAPSSSAGAPAMPLGTPNRLPGPDQTAPMMTVGGDGGAGDGAGRKRSRGAVVGAVVGVTALVATGAFAVVKITGNDTAGGAASAAEVGTALTTALDNEDFLGVIDLLLPGERETFREPLIDFVEHLSRLEILSDTADLSKIGGVDIQFTDVTVREDETNVADISNIYLSGSSTVTVDGDELPLGDLLLDQFDMDGSDMDTEPESSEFEDTKMTVVERDGRWYLSAFYSAAESARGDDDIPETGVEAKGADSPEGAVDGLFDAVSGLDLEELIAILDPSEAEALQRYAPLFLDDAQDEIDDVDIDWAISDTSYSVSGDGSRRSVSVEALTFDATIPDIGTVRAEFADGCVTATVEPDDSDGEPEEVSWCNDDTADAALGVFEDDEDAMKLFEVIDEAFGDYTPNGIAVHEVDGQWYVSPLRTTFDGVNGVLAALDADELRDIIDAAEDFADSFSGDIFDPFGDLESDFPTDDPADEDYDPLDDPMLPIDPPTEDSIVPGDAGDDGDDSFDAYTACFSETDAAAGIACLNDGIAAGTIDPLYVSPHYRFPECGVAEAYWSDIYTMSDADFVALAQGASPCFLDLVANGRVEAWEVAGELLAPECLEGKNWYTTYEEDYNDRFYDCTAKVRDSL